jgi:hypothetical protein
MKVGTKREVGTTILEKRKRRGEPVSRPGKWNSNVVCRRKTLPNPIRYSS